MLEKIYKIKSENIEVLYKNKDFKEEKNKIIFKDDTYIYKNQLSCIVKVPKGGYVIYTTFDDCLFEFQRELKDFD